jgi:hypothetical protein
VTHCVRWIAAEDGEPKFLPASGLRNEHSFSQSAGWRNFPVHGFARDGESEQQWEEGLLDCDPELSFYRRRTIKLLNRYQRFSLETGRLPSLLGREFFRTTVTSYRSVTFEDRVIFVRDVEKILERLDYWDQQLVARVILQEHSYDRAAYLLHCSRKTIQRRLPEVLDILSQEFLEIGLLVAIPE